jgi:hypothetical protein
VTALCRLQIANFFAQKIDRGSVHLT